jgi:hypothetical protein
VLLFRADPELEAPLDRLARLLADAVETLFGEQVAMLAVTDGDPVAARSAVDRCFSRGAHHVFLDTSRTGAADRAALELIATQVVHLSVHEDAPLPRVPAGCELLRTVVLSGEPTAVRLSPEKLRMRTILKRMAKGAARRTPASTGWSAPYSARETPPWCRVRLDLSAVARMPELRMRAASPALVDTLARWRAPSRTGVSGWRWAAAARGATRARRSSSTCIAAASPSIS